MSVENATFGQFANGGDLLDNDIVVGLRGGVNTKFIYTGSGGGGGDVNSITGTQDQVLVNGTYGTPEVGDITLALPQSIAPNNAPTFLGLTLTNPLTVPNGGTGKSSFTPYSIVCAGITSTGDFSNVLGLGNSGQVLTSNGAGAYPTWVDGGSVTPADMTSVNDTNVTLTLGGSPATSLLAATSLSMGWTGELSVSRGGTGLASTTAYAVLCGGTTSTDPLQPVASVGLTGQALISNGPGVLPTFQDIPGGGTVNAGLVNELAWYAASGTAVSGLPTANDGVLLTDSTGVPIISPSSALTKLDDTNVTITLGGTPANSLLKSVSLTMGWTGQLSVPRGGTGLASTTEYAVLCGGTTSTSPLQPVASVGTAGQVLTSNGAGALPTFQTSSGGSGVPVGTIIDFAGTAVPTDYLVCDGSSQLVATYPALHAAIGYTWGGAGANFNLPNFERRTSIGSGGTGTATIGNAVGNTGGEEGHTMTIAEMAAHDHPGSTGGQVVGVIGISAGGNPLLYGSSNTHVISVASEGSSTPFNVIQPSAVVLKCIKYQ